MEVCIPFTKYTKLDLRLAIYKSSLHYSNAMHAVKLYNIIPWPVKVFVLLGEKPVIDGKPESKDACRQTERHDSVNQANNGARSSLFNFIGCSCVQYLDLYASAVRGSRKYPDTRSLRLQVSTF